MVGDTDPGAQTQANGAYAKSIFSRGFKGRVPFRNQDDKAKTMLGCGYTFVLCNFVVGCILCAAGVAACGLLAKNHNLNLVL